MQDQLILGEKRKKRNSGIELLKVLSTIMIVISHSQPKLEGVVVEKMRGGGYSTLRLRRIIGKY